MKILQTITVLATSLFLAACSTTDMQAPLSPDHAAFEQADHDNWQSVFSDSCTSDWTEQWFLDGEVGTVTTGPDGMELTAGPEFKNDAHHMVL
jgi:uncharacterized lipoprotein YajG